MMVKVRLAGVYAVEVLGRQLAPGQVIEVDEEIAADLCREGRPFERVEEAPRRRKPEEPAGGDGA